MFSILDKWIGIYARYVTSGVPSDMKSSKHIIVAVCTFVISVIIGIFIIYENAIEVDIVDWWMLGLGIIFILASPFFAMIAKKICFIVDSKKSQCPNCGQSFCIDYLESKTISEKVISESRNNQKVSYRVGVKRIHWQCEKCGYESEDEIKYKERA